MGRAGTSRPLAHAPDDMFSSYESVIDRLQHRARAIAHAEAVELRHAEIEKDDVGLFALDYVDRFFAVGRFGGDGDVGIERQETAQSLSHDRLIFDQADANHSDAPRSSAGFRRASILPA